MVFAVDMARRSAPRTFLLILGSLLVLFLTASAMGQDSNLPPLSNPGYTKAVPVDVGSGTPFAPVTTLTFPQGARSSREIFVLKAPAGAAGNAAGSQGNSNANNANGVHGHPGGNISGLVTVPTFAGAFAAQGSEDTGQVFPFIMMGNHPQAGGRTTIPTKITAVSLQLLNADGSVRFVVPFAPFEDVTEDSPNFETTDYRSGRNIQFGDAIQRAEFFNSMRRDWHTNLGEPQFVDRVTLTIPRFVNVQFADGSVKSVQAYFVGTAPDGSHFVELLDLLFNFLDTNLVVNEIISGNFTTDAFNFDLYPNTFLFSINDQGQFSDCCVLGFHTYFAEGGTVPQPRWIYSFSSFISPGLFGAGFQDVTALSHEISEAFNDPFVNNAVPVWQFPGVPANARVCQDNLETGDPVEVLATATVPITLRERREVFIYHPQTEALLQWFEMGATSDAIDGAFSFPDETALPHSALPCPPPPPHP